ncbi:SEC-C metal-binding domain-containing protein [Enorma phocaeensis]|uniref:SEC-C metal-binding domain-containing protein n=1 Tax=Enorma phocaeensis TaxID=1871019 RepID=UPI0023543E24|nr:SEC-C metal-binding domain-containing protein [Enorma phocaeensis]
MHLSPSQARRLYRILDALTVYLNRKHRVIVPALLYDPETGQVSDQARAEVLPLAWDVPELLDEFADANPAGLPAADLAEVRRWRHCVSGLATLLDYDAAGRGLISLGDDEVVAVLGISRDFKAVVNRPAPLIIGLTMLPFENVVTYDTTVSIQDISLGPGIMAMLDEERASIPNRRLLLTADDFIPAAQAAHERRRASELERLERDLEHDRIEAGGAEQLPPGVHRGVLAGLSEPERDAAIERSLSERYEKGAGVLPYLKKLAVKRAATTDLEQALAADTKAALEADAKRLGLRGVSKLRKAELAHAIAEALRDGELAARELMDFLLDCYPAEFKTFKSILAMPQGAFSFTEAEAAEHPGLMVYAPYTRLYLHEGRFTAIIPDEYRQAMEHIDLDDLERQRSRAESIVHLGEVLVGFCGIVSIQGLAARVQELHGFTPDEDEARRILAAAARREMPYAPFELWRDPQGDDAWYLVHSSLGDHALVDIVRRSMEREIDAIDFDSMSPQEQAALIERYADSAYLLHEVQEKQSQRDRYLHDLMALHREKDAEGPCPLPAELAQQDPFEWQAQLPEAINLRNWLDAHVPDDEDDMLFADDVVSELIEVNETSGEPNAFLNAAADMDLLTLTEDTQAILGRIMALANALPKWENNGWAPNALFEREVGHRVFHNPDGSEMRVGRNDPCPCGSGKKYKKCCGR